jgi:hypothetical protein
LGCPLHWTLFYLKKIYSLWTNFEDETSTSH